MRKLDVDSQGNTQQYLIERGGDLIEAINHFKPRAGLKYQEGFVLINNGSVVGAEKQPTSYPYVVVLEADDERNVIYCVFVKPTAFTALPDGSQHLYEFDVRRVDRNSPYRVRESKYQIIALDVFEAHLKLGQIYSNYDDYELEILNWKQVH